MARLHNLSPVRKPVGWRNDSYRHYLASKGVSSSRFVKRQKHDYFARDFLKGNRDDPSDPYAAIRKSLNSQGYNSSEQERMFNIPMKPKKSKVLIDVPDRDQIAGARFEGQVSPTAAVAPLPTPSIEVDDFSEAEVAPPMPLDIPIEDKTVSELSVKEKRLLMDQVETRGIPDPPPSFATPGVAELPPSSPFSQAPLVTTPAQQLFMDGSAETVVKMEPKAKKRKSKKFDFVGINDGREAIPMFSLKSDEDFL